MILYFYLNLGTSCLNTSSIWDEHLLGKKKKNLPIEPCERWPYETKLPPRTQPKRGLLNWNPVTAAISLWSQTVATRISDQPQDGLREAPFRGGNVTLDYLCHLLPLLSQRLGRDNRNKPITMKKLTGDTRATEIESWV